MALSANKLAQILGVNAYTITNRVRRGDFKDTVKQVNGRFIFDDRALELAKTLGIGNNVNAMKEKLRAERELEKAAAEAGLEPPEEKPNEFADMNLIQAKTKKEAYQAELARLDYEVKSGVLIQAKDVEKHAFKAFRELRDSVLNLPSKISPELASMDDPFAIQRMLDGHLREALMNLSDTLEKTFVVSQDE